MPPTHRWTTFIVSYILIGSTFGNPLPVSAQTALVNFVQNGGGFIGSQWNGFERTIGQQVNMNDLVLQLWADQSGTENCGGCNVTYTVVPAQASHPVLAGVPSPFTFFADGHDAGSQVVFAVDPSTVLMTVSSGREGVLVREFGGGRVVNFSHAANYLNQGITLQDPNIQQLYINAVNWACVLQVDVDIEPHSCPNYLDIQSDGVLPVAIVGTANLDVSTIDPNSVRLEGIAPVAGRDKKDVTRPVVGRQNVCDCTTGGDDIADLSFTFSIPELRVALGDLEPVDEVEVVLTLTGVLRDGTPFEGKDCVVILNR